MIRFLFAVILFFQISNIFSQTLAWQKNYGGKDNDRANTIIATSDGGYLFAGKTNSKGGDVSKLIGLDDLWVVKLDNSGNIQWERCYGGPLHEEAYSILAVDGGYLIGGYTNSKSVNVSGNHGSDDFWVIRIDNIGQLIWQRCFGGYSSDQGYCLEATADGNFIIAGGSQWDEATVSENKGAMDGWIVKFDDSGNELLSKWFGGKQGEWFTSVKRTRDNGFIAVGPTYSDDEYVTGNNGGSDYWVVKLDKNLDLEWQRCIGGSADDQPMDVIQTVEGDFVVVGSSESTDGDTIGHILGKDYWVVSLDSEGKIRWQRSFGGTYDDVAYDVMQDKSGDFIIVGSTDSYDLDALGNHGYEDILLLRLNASGELMWNKCFGGTNTEIPISADVLPEGLIVAGMAKSKDGDVKGNKGGEDAWVLKVVY